MILRVELNNGNCITVPLRTQRSAPDVLKTLAALGHMPVRWALETEPGEAERCMKNYIQTTQPYCGQ